ncbi:MAG: universal stress protein [Deltaproteobacteria bacterium]|nr:universal stress protein [Deltaproteobacteria bacterium]
MVCLRRPSGQPNVREPWTGNDLGAGSHQLSSGNHSDPTAERFDDGPTRNRSLGLERLATGRRQSAGEDLMSFILDMREHIEMVVVGVRKTSAVGKAVFGSTVQHLILHSPCPVATVNPGTERD